MDYYFRTRGKVFGPFNEALLVKMRDSRKIGRTTEVSDDGINWKPASSFDVLYPTDTSEAMLPPPEPMEWNYSIDGSQGFGPVPQSTIVTLLQSQRLNARSYVWRQGEKARPIRKVPDFTLFLPTNADQRTGSEGYVLWGSIAVVLLICIVVLGYVLIQRGFRQKSDSQASSASKSAQLVKSAKSAKDSGLLSITGSSVSLPPEEVFKRAAPSTAFVKNQRGGGGSGFLIDHNILATNHHVIEKDFIERVEVFFPSASGKQQGPFKAKLLYANVERDIAFLGVDSGLSPIPVAKGYQIKPTEQIVIIGTPGATVKNAPTIGRMGVEHEQYGLMWYQLDASTNKGNSGGPVLDMYGRVIGILSAGSLDINDKIMEGISLSIPTPDILEALTTVKKLSDKEKEHNNSQHRARVAIDMLAITTFVFLKCMDDYDTFMELAIKDGLSPNDGIKAVAEIIEGRMEAVQEIFLDNVEKELDKIKQDANLSVKFRETLAECHANCKEIKSYVDRPRGTPASYRQKMFELRETGERLLRQLRSLEGLSDK